MFLYTGTNISDAKETVATLINDIEDKKLKYYDDYYEPKLNILENNSIVSWDDYLRINSYEISRGKISNPSKIREKIVCIDQFLQVANMK